jgi:signal transduction histidine kinase/DNA-binding response OmpR family regulator
LADKINIARETEKQLGETKQQLFESELHSVEEQHKAEKAELASQAKSQFLASMSHEIRTPMNAILGYAQLLMMDRQINPEQRQQLEIINRSGDHLLGLINDVLDMAKIESAQITMNPSDCDLYALIDDVMAMVMVRAEDKGLSLELQLDEDLPRFVHLDGAKLRQILINLIGNAIKFTEFGGISISAGLKSHAFGSDVAKIYFDIEDTGAGIAEEERDKVFSQFEQTSSGINEGGGTGLGMPISLEFCRLMGGDLTFTSVVNQGSVFTVVVEAPMAHNAIDNMSHRHKQVVGIKSVKGGKALHELKVLIVDDIASNRNLLAALIQPLGLNCSFAGNGEESITRFLSDKPDLIMMDLRMPKLGGLDAIKRIRSHSKGHDVAIIVVSASAFEADRIDIMEAGADAFLRKPFKTHRVYRMVQKYLGLEYEYAEDESPQAHLQEDADVQGEPRSHSASADSSVSAPEGIAPINTKQGLHLVTEAPLSGCKEYNMEDEQAKDFRILVVDDNDVNIMLCQKQLETLGYESDAAENGQQAVERYQQQAYSLILMDYEMPVMGGLLAAQHIRQWEQEKGLSACTIIGLSAHKGEHEAEALSAGMDEFLSKPLRVVDLKEVLTRYLSQREAL